MELRHLRYFVAVAEAGSLTVAAEKLLHTAQPSLSRQIRALENDVGTQLLTRNAHGIELTAAGKAFLDHARLALIQVDAASEAARRAAKPNKPTFAVGFLTGQEIDWLPEVMRVLRDKLPKIDVTVSSQSSSHDLGENLMRGKLDVAFLRAEVTPRRLHHVGLVVAPLRLSNRGYHRSGDQWAGREPLSAQAPLGGSGSFRRVLPGTGRRTPRLKIRAEWDMLQLVHRNC